MLAAIAKRLFSRPPCRGGEGVVCRATFLTAFLFGFFQYAAAAPAAPINGPLPAPLLCVRFVAPQSMKVVFHTGKHQTRSFSAPVTAGLRPGYIYRVQLSGFPGHPGLVLYPSLEVRGSLQLPKAARPFDYPVPLAFSADDVERTLRGELVTKAIVVEHPDQALPAPSTPEQPLELDVGPRDAVAEARLHGRLVLIVRLGGREVTGEELEQHAVPGTVLLPGDRLLPPPAAPPYMPWACFRMIDPIAGAKPPDEECLQDGGDTGIRAGIGPNGEILGLDPSDTAAAYTDSRGQRKVSVSNRICVCVPRFLVVRGVTGLVGYTTALNPVGAQAVHGQTQMQARVPSMEANQNKHLGAARGRAKGSGLLASENLDFVSRVQALNAYHVEVELGEQLGTFRMLLLTEEQRTQLSKKMEFALGFQRLAAPSGNQSIQEGPVAVGRVAGVDVYVGAQDTREVLASCHEVTPPPPDKPLYLYKWADRQSAKVGDVVTFYLKCSNVGGHTITDVAVSDSLTGRLDYIPGSAKSDRDAVFTTRTNTAGSLVLHWEIRGPLLANQSGIVTFQARVR